MGTHTITWYFINVCCTLDSVLYEGFNVLGRLSLITFKQIIVEEKNV